MADAVRAAEVRYSVPRWDPAWAVPEVPVPESNIHDLALVYLRSVLDQWVARMGRNILVARNLGIRWIESEPRIGFDPDLCLIEPDPTPKHELTTLRTFVPGQSVPPLAIEVVSHSHPYKDYIDTPDRCVACGVGELWVYDPLLAGPKSRGGPYLLQVWSQDERGNFARLHAGSGPAYSPFLSAWLHPMATRTARDAKLRVSSQENGGDYWPTELEAERTKLEAERTKHAAERTKHEAEVAELQARIAQLEAKPP